VGNNFDAENRSQSVKLAIGIEYEQESNKVQTASDASRSSMASHRNALCAMSDRRGTGHKGEPATTGRQRSMKLPAAPTPDATRRTEILKAANAIIASSGLRTSLQQIAGAAGILPGSLYHHFPSKGVIFVELLRRFHADLDSVGATAVARLDEPTTAPVSEQVIALGCAIASCAVEHTAALQMSFFQAPGDDPEFLALARLRPAKIQEAMVQLLRTGRWSGYIRPDLDAPTLADRICQAVLHIGLDIMRHDASSDQVATLLCRMMLEGLAVVPPNDAELDRSSAFAAANAVIETGPTKSAATTRPHISARSRAPNSGVAATRSPQCATSRPPQGWRREPFSA
jgi:AcrR family transcriptional regulator